MERKGQKLVIGRRESVAFPDWGIEGILAKVDTGARTSCVHAENMLEVKGGLVAFDLVLSRKHPDHRKKLEAKIVRHSRVRSSLGRVSERFVISAVVGIGPVRKVVQVSLVSREEMKCRMLLGREALMGDFVVDPARTFVLTDRDAHLD